MNKPVFTTHDIARIISVDVSTISAWIDQNKLAAYRTPGGHRRVSRENLLSFMKARGIPLPAAADGPTLLIVEDDADFRRALRGLVEPLPGATVHEAEDGFTAGRRVEELKPDVVLLDLMLPGTDGFKVCEQIRRDPDLQETRVIVISGHDTPENRARAERAGADAFLAKPLGLPRLREMILSLMTRPHAGGMKK